MQKLIIAIIIIALILSGILVATPFIINKDNLKDNLLTKINAQTGLGIKSNGIARLSLIPYMYMELEDVYIENNKKSSSSNFFSAHKVKIFVNVFSLLKSDIKIEQIKIESPSLEIEKFQDGDSNWSFIYDNLKSKLSTKSVNGDLIKISIENGTVSNTRGLNKTSLNSVNSYIEYNTKTKSLVSNGNFSNNQSKISFYTNLHSNSKNDSSIELKTQSSTFKFTGKYSEKSGSIKGKIDGDIQNISEFSKVIFDESSKLNSISSKDELKITGDLSISSKLLNFSKIALKSNSIKGNIDLSYSLNLLSNKNSLLDLKVNLVNLDLDKLFADSVKKDDGIVDYYSYNTNSLKLSDFNFSLPSKVDVTTDVKFEKITFLEREIKDVNLSTSLKSGKADISELSMILPGNSKLKLQAQISNNGIRPYLEGKLDVYGNKFRDLVIWLSPELNFIPQEVMNNFAFSSNLSVTPLKFKLDDISLIFDRSIINGGIFINPHKKIPQLNANILIDRLNLDNYNITKKYFSDQGKLINGIGSMFSPKSWLRRITSNYNLVIESKNITLNNNTIDHIKLSSAISPSSLKIRDFNLESKNSDMKIKSEINFITDIPKFDFELDSQKINLNDFYASSAKSEEKSSEDLVDKLKKIKVKTYGIEQFSGLVTANVKSLRTKNFNIDNVSIDSQLKGSRIQKKVTFNAFGGTAGFYGLSFISPDRISLQGKYVLKQVDLKGLSGEFFDNKINLTGKLSSSGRIRSSGRNFYNLLLSLKTVNSTGVNGDQTNNNFTISNLEIDNYNVEKIIENSYKVKSAQDIANIASQAKKGGKSLFSQVKGSLSINRGIFKIYDSSFYNKISVSSLILSSSLFTNQLVGKFETYFQINKNKNLSFFTELAGYTDNITRKINVREIEDYISRRKSK